LTGTFLKINHKIIEDLSLVGKVVLITGSSRGIGADTALKLSEAGATVIINYRKPESYTDALRVQAAIKNLGGDACILRADVSKSLEVENLMGNIKNMFGRLDILVNNAGITMDRTIQNMPERWWDRTLDVNLKGVWLCCKKAIEVFMKNQRRGKIINVSSIVGLFGNFGQTNYAASKAGIIGLSKSLAKEASRYNIQVNVVAPGFINTQMYRKIPSKYKREVLKNILMRRVGEPEEVANVILFLASNMSSYVNGAVITVDGGYSS
jgi:3-oxoacyl-[acyl-carrier protein] reductase